MSRHNERITATSYYSQNIEYHSAWLDFLVQRDFTHVLTLQWNRKIDCDLARTDLKKLLLHIDRDLLGPRFHTKPNRTEALFFLEGEENLTLHAHAFFKVATEHHNDFSAMFPMNRHMSESLWKCLIPSGTYALYINDDPIAAACYLTKDCHLRGDDRRIIFSGDFTPILPVPSEG